MHMTKRGEYLAIDQIHESTTNPRRTFDESKLRELAESIRANGLIQPITVRPNNQGFEIVAGARRYRASQLAELFSVPARIVEIDDATALEWQIDPYTITEDVADHFAEENNDHQQTPEEILASALSQTPDEKLTSFALRLALTGYVTIPRENERDFLAEAQALFVPPPPVKEKKPKKSPIPIKAAPKKAATKKRVAA